MAAPTTSDYEIIKKPGKTPMTPEQQREFIKCSMDPLYYMENYMYITHPKTGRQKFQADPFQRDLVNTYWNFQNSIAMIPRQSGKCLQSETSINIKNKTTGKVYEIPIGIYYEWMSAMRRGTLPPDIEQYERTG